MKKTKAEDNYNKLKELLQAYNSGTIKKKSKSCPDLNLVCGYIDKTLNTEERTTVENHLSSCEHCLHLMASIQRDIDSLDTDLMMKEILGNIAEKDRIKEELSMICPKCKSQNVSEALYCGGCGASLRKAIQIPCPKCNKPVTEGNKFCNYCGTKIVGDTKDKKALLEVLKEWLPPQISENKWLVGSIATILASFAFPAIFLQFLLAAGIMGGAWLLDRSKLINLKEIMEIWKTDKKKALVEAKKFKKTINKKR